MKTILVILIILGVSCTNIGNTAASIPDWQLRYSLYEGQLSIAPNSHRAFFANQSAGWKTTINYTLQFSLLNNTKTQPQLTYQNTGFNFFICNRTAYDAWLAQPPTFDTYTGPGDSWEEDFIIPYTDEWVYIFENIDDYFTKIIDVEINVYEWSEQTPLGPFGNIPLAVFLAIIGIGSIIVVIVIGFTLWKNRSVNEA